MGTITRSNKPNGSTDWADGDTITDSGSGNLNTDFNTAFNEINGNLDNDNIAAGAAIAGSKLANGAISNTQVNSSASIDPTKLGDYSGTDTQQNTLSDPGDSDSNTLATDMSDELEQIRWAIRRTSLGDNTKITDGSTSGLGSDGNAAWFDGSVIGASVIRNGSFLDHEADSSAPTPPYGWDVIDGGGGGPSTLTTVSLDVAEGAGDAIHMVDSGNVSRDGISQTLAGLKASSRYLVVARIKPITTTWQVTTTGATGTFGNLDLTSASGGSAWETLAGIIETDSTPTDIVVNLIAGASASECHVASCHAYPIGDDRTYRDRHFIRHADSTSTTEATVESDLTVSVVVPGPNYSIRVQTKMAITVGSGTVNGTIALKESVDGGMASTVDSSIGSASVVFLSEFDQIGNLYLNSSPVSGSVYTYTVDVVLDANCSIFGHSWIIAELIPH